MLILWELFQNALNRPFDKFKQLGISSESLTKYSHLLASLEIITYLIMFVIIKTCRLLCFKTVCLAS